MSKRWKVRKKNAAKKEKSAQIMSDFYNNVINALQNEHDRIKAAQPK